MKSGVQSLCRALMAASLALGTGLGAEEAALALRTQTMRLEPGWNAVYLEVYPSEAEPGRVFAGLPVDVVASFYERPVAAQFMTDPGADLFRKAGWGVWYAEDRPDAFLKSLHAIHGQQAYLVHATRGFVWQVTGAVVVSEVAWTPHAYNLVGFAVDAQSPPTFAQFFDGSPAHRHDRIFRLLDGVWRRVTAPGAERMRSGEAFWIYCQGASNYRGPLAVETRTRQGVLVGQGAVPVTLRNRTSFPVVPVFEHVPSGGPAVPLSLVVRALGEGQGEMRSVAVPRPEGAWSFELPALEAGQSLQVPLEARTESLTRPTQASVLRVRSDLGTEVWLPVFAIRPDLEEPR